MSTKVKVAPTKKDTKFVINCEVPVKDKIFDVASFEKFLNDRVKVNGKTGALGDVVSIARDGNKVVIVAKISFSKRYLKYLTKKFLKKFQLRDFVRVIADTKNSYDLRYFNIRTDADADE